MGHNLIEGPHVTRMVHSADAQCTAGLFAQSVFYLRFVGMALALTYLVMLPRGGLGLGLALAGMGLVCFGTNRETFGVFCVLLAPPLGGLVMRIAGLPHVGAPVRAPARRAHQRGPYRLLAVEFWDWTTELGLWGNPTLQWARANRLRLDGFYRKLHERARHADVVLISQTGGILPEVMAELDSLVVYNTADDPDSSGICSFPFVASADVIAHAGVTFDAQQTVAQVLLARGAKQCVHFPLGFYEESFPALDDFDVQFGRRDIDLVYLGHLKRGKLEPIMRRFRGMCVHSRSLKLKHKLYLLAQTGKWVRPFAGDVAALYHRCKVGVNMHFTFGPSNARCYQLNAAGVAQVVDCREGIAALYAPGDEVVCYGSVDEAIEAINRLLVDRDLRYRIASAGYQRARRDYNRRNIITRLMREV